MIKTTASLSWGPDSKIWINVCASRRSSIFLWYTDTCHEIPRFPKKLLWASLYRDSINFIAKSCTISTEEKSKDWRTFSREQSWCTLRSWCDFHSEMARFAFCNRSWTSSLSSSHKNSLLSASFWISFRTYRNECKATTLLNLISCTPSHSWTSLWRLLYNNGLMKMKLMLLKLMLLENLS